jgi:hypothetical protein
MDFQNVGQIVAVLRQVDGADKVESAEQSLEIDAERACGR